MIEGAPRLSPKQVLSIGQSTARINIWEGSIRSGKTISSLWRWLMYVANAPHDGELVMFGKTRDSVASNLFEPLSNPDIFGEFSRDVEYTSGAPAAKIFGRRIRIIGANDAKAEPKVRGGTWTGAYGDELTTLPESFFRQALGRLSTPTAALFGTTNPDNPGHWLRQDFLLDPKLNLRSWHFTIDDNPHLDPGYVANIKAEYKGLWHKRFIQGLWIAAQGSIYDMWDEDLHLLKGPVPQLMALPGVGLDYGTTNAFSALMLGVAAPNHVTGTPARLVLTREYRHDPKLAQRQKTDAEFSADVRAWIGQDRPHWVCVDPSAASFKLQLFRDGLSNVMNANNDVLDGVRLVSSLLATGHLVVHESCKGLRTELPGYAWDPAASMKGQDVPIKVDDHSCFVAGTLVRTIDGEVPIELIRSGDLVATRAGWQPVAEAGMTTESARVFDVELSNGHTLTGTGNHPIWVAGHGWKNLDSLRYGDRMMTWPEAKSSSSTGPSSGGTRTLLTIPTSAISRLASAIARRGSSAFTKKCGWPVTGRSPRVSTSITRTTTLSTTTSPTWSASTPTSTERTTPKTPDYAGCPTVSWSTSPAYGRSLSRGISRLRAVSGIGSTAKTSGPTDLPCPMPGRDARLPPGLASSAALSTGLEPCRRAGSAPTPASRHGEGQPASTTSTGRASAAERRSGSTGTPGPGSAPEVAASETQRQSARRAADTGRPFRPQSASVSGAARPTSAKRPRVSAAGTAQPAVGRRLAMPRLRSTISYVSSAELPSRTRSRRPAPAPVHVLRITATLGERPVYNLTVTGQPEYFAAGVLVHNCDAARYAIASTQTLWRPYIPRTAPILQAA